MKSLLYAIALLLVTGCSSNVVMSGRQVSNVDSDATITTQSRIRVEPLTAEDPLTNKRYLPQVVQAFQANGFHYIGPLLVNPDFSARFHLTSEVVEREFQEPIYRDVRTGRSTHCYQDKDGGNHCDTDYHVMPYLVGYETLTRSVLVAKFSLAILDPEGNTVLSSTSSVETNDCSRWKLYEFLIQYSIQHLDLHSPLDSPFHIEMPEDYQCTDSIQT